MNTLQALAAGSFAVAAAYSALGALRAARRDAAKPPQRHEPEHVLINGTFILVDPDNAFSPLTCFLLKTAVAWSLVFSAALALLNVASLFTDAVEPRFVVFPYLSYWSWCACAALVYVCAFNAAHLVQTVWRDGVVLPEDSPCGRQFWVRAVGRATVKGTILFALFLVYMHPAKMVASAILLYAYIFENDYRDAYAYTAATAAWLAMRLVEP